MSSHYFDATPASRSARRTVPLALPDLTVQLATDRGVFSAERVDPGTKYLLLDAPQPHGGATHLADLGCGYGPIAITLAHRCPAATVWAPDTNERAVALCEHNARALGLANVHPLLVRDLAHPTATLPTAVQLDAIYSNPPIRVGKESLHALLLAWLGRLAPGGHAYLVVQKHLGSDSLQSWLTDHGHRTERLGSRAGYRLLDVHGAPA